MGIDVGESERVVTKERVEYIDSLTENQNIRTDKVWKVLDEFNKKNPDKKLGNWDILCFCISYLVTAASMYDWIKPFAFRLKNLAFNAHYLFPVGHGIIDEKT